MPDLDARSLRRQRTDRVCLLTPRPGVPWTDLLLTRLQEEAAGHACSVLTLTVDTRTGDALHRRRGDGRSATPGSVCP
ncbi:MAG TPA: hypothetical protein VIA06_18955 [Candidatus Dormibacteraeota bacterium]|nr:hypothetical protein [Candidatus Dormibacteraeota bacterium]